MVKVTTRGSEPGNPAEVALVFTTRPTQLRVLPLRSEELEDSASPVGGLASDGAIDGAIFTVWVPTEARDLDVVFTSDCL